MIYPRFQRCLQAALALRVWAAILVLMGAAGCAHHYVLNSPADARTLPVRRGWEGINVVAVTPWRYMGSRYLTHEFRYYFDRDDALRQEGELAPMRRIGQAGEIADVVAFLLSDRSSYMNGVEVTVDGGARARCFAYSPLTLPD